MRILIVHNTLNDSTSMNGVLRHFTGMANEWIALGHQTDFLLAKAGWPQLQELAPNSRLISSDNFFNATRHLRQTWRNFPAYAYRMLTAHWTRLVPCYDIIYASAQLIFEVYPAYILAHRGKARFAIKMHHILTTQSGRRGLFDRLFQWSERGSVRLINQKADLIICSTEIVANDYHKLEAGLGLSPRPTQQIAYGLDLTRIAPQWKRPKSYDVVFLGRIHSHKGVFEIPLAWKEVVKNLPQARLLIIGEGPHRQRTEELFRELGLADTVKFTGGISEDLKNDYLTQCKIGISLSYEEGWGLSITEYLAAGLPVVAYELPVYSFAFPGQLDLVKPGDTQEMARKIVSLLHDPARLIQRGWQARTFVERYDYRNIARMELGAIKALFST